MIHIERLCQAIINKTDTHNEYGWHVINTTFGKTIIGNLEDREIIIFDRFEFYIHPAYETTETVALLKDFIIKYNEIERIRNEKYPDIINITILDAQKMDSETIYNLLDNEASYIARKKPISCEPIHTFWHGTKFTGVYLS